VPGWAEVMHQPTSGRYRWLNGINRPRSPERAQPGAQKKPRQAGYLTGLWGVALMADALRL